MCLDLKTKTEPIPISHWRQGRGLRSDTGVKNQRQDCNDYQFSAGFGMTVFVGVWALFWL